MHRFSLDAIPTKGILIKVHNERRIMTDPREERGQQIAALAKVTRREDGSWRVPSMSGNDPYTVRLGHEPHCTCPDHETRGCKCKHIFAVEYFLKRETEVRPDGSTVVTETIAKRTTYPQNWPAYNSAQQHEKDEFQALLADLRRGIENRPQNGRGRRYINLGDAVFACVFKVYSTVSGRRFTCDLNEAKERGYIVDVAHFNSIFDYLQNPLLTDILKGLIVTSSLPLREIERDFAVDSTGFTSSRFHRWFDHKYGAMRQEHDWVKVHICTGVKTNVVTAVEVLDRNAADSPLLPALVETTAKNFPVSEVSADKGYSSMDNHDAITAMGATPFIAFKKNSTGSGSNNGGRRTSTVWYKMFHFFSFQRDEFLAHYHKRSNVESTVSMIKAKFGDSVRSKTDVAMRNEALCKVLCHNICCMISAVYELGIQPNFLPSAA
jgi:transposase